MYRISLYVSVYFLHICLPGYMYKVYILCVRMLVIGLVYISPGCVFIRLNVSVFACEV